MAADLDIAQRLRDQLRDQLVEQVNHHGTTAAFLVTDVECDLLTDGELICGRHRPRTNLTAHRGSLTTEHTSDEVAGWFRGVPIILASKDDLTAVNETTATIHQWYDAATAEFDREVRQG